jgi:hypothetical protein
MANSAIGKQMTEKELALLIKHLNLEQSEADLLHESLGEVTEMGHSGDARQDGWVEVKDQRIIVHDPIHGGEWPVLSSKAPVKLFVNGVYVETERTVASSDRIYWEIDERPLFEISVSEDKLVANFRLRAKDRYAWKLVKSEPSLNVVVQAVEDPTIVLESVHISDVASQIERKSIKSNLDIAAIHQELTSPTCLPVVIAKGRAAVQGQDAKLELYFSEQVESQFFEIGGAVDYRNHLQIPSVNDGDLIAKKIPLQDGTPGYDVYGDVLMPTPAKDIIIVAKSGVELTPEGEVIARKVGRPRMTGGKIRTFDISSSYIVSGNVDMETGNIVFSGDVIVYGDVLDRMIIESLGNVYVFGCVYNATITATGSIHVRGNVLGSKLYSGYFGVMFNRLYNTSKALSEQMEKLLAAATMLEQALAAKRQSVRFGQLVLLLMENKFPEIPSTMKELLAVVANIQHIKKKEYEGLQEMSVMFLQPARMVELATLSNVQGLIALLRDTHQEVARMQESSVKIMINQCHNSELKSNGDINIEREGVLLSDLFSTGNIQFKQEYSVCRGSRLEADGAISAKIVGGMTGTAAFLKAKRQVAVKKMYSGRVCVGRYSTDIFETIENRTFMMNNMKLRA